MDISKTHQRSICSCTGNACELVCAQATVGRNLARLVRHRADGHLTNDEFIIEATLLVHETQMDRGPDNGELAS